MQINKIENETWGISDLQNEGNSTITTMRESRRMRSNELHYLDHPYLGLLILVTPLEEAHTDKQDS